jgi:hypothetical protein
LLEYCSSSTKANKLIQQPSTATPPELRHRQGLGVQPLTAEGLNLRTELCITLQLDCSSNPEKRDRDKKLSVHIKTSSIARPPCRIIRNFVLVGLALVGALDSPP